MEKVLHGDCLELMKEIPNKSIDMILCDLPYGTTQNKWDSIIPLEPLWEQYERIIKDNGAIVLTAQTPFDKVLGASNLKLPTYNPQMRVGEPYNKKSAKGSSNYGKQFSVKTLNSGERYPVSIIECTNASRKGKLHPTQKPVELFEYLIKTYTNEGDLVLDNAAGSGTTGVACRNLGRDFILMEKEQEYIDIIHERLSEHD